MLIKDIQDGRDYYMLSVQTNAGLVWEAMRWKASHWAPKRAKSYMIFNTRHTDYYGYTTDDETGYGSFNVMYYTTVKEGEFPIDRNAPYPILPR